MSSPATLPIDDALAEAVSRALKLEGFFPEFLAEHLEKLFPRSFFAAYPEGHVLVREGEEGRDLFVVVDGEVSIRRAGLEGALATLKAGDLLGEIGLLKNGRRTASAVVAAPARLFRLSHQDLGYLLNHNPELSAHLLALAASRLPPS